MTMLRNFRAVAALAVALCAGSASANEYKLGSLQVGHPWTRVTPGKTGSAYLSVTNTGAEVDRLVGASSPAADKAELHTHQMDGDVMRMRPVQAIEVPPGESAVLKPGGLMLLSFSDRWFPAKAIRVWSGLHAFERLGLVPSLLRQAGFTGLQTETLRGVRRPQDDKCIGQNVALFCGALPGRQHISV